RFPVFTMCSGLHSTCDLQVTKQRAMIPPAARKPLLCAHGQTDQYLSAYAENHFRAIAALLLRELQTNPECAAIRLDNRKRIFKQLYIRRKFRFKINAHDIKTEWRVCFYFAQEFAG